MNFDNTTKPALKASEKITKTDSGDDNKTTAALKSLRATIASFIEAHPDLKGKLLENLSAEKEQELVKELNELTEQENEIVREYNETHETKLKELETLSAPKKTEITRFKVGYDGE